MKGLNIYKTKDGFCVAETHYTSDPDKDPDRNGREWMEMALRGVPGGKTSAAWRKEMEIDFTAYSGQLFCYHILNEYRNKIVIDKPIQDYEHKYGSLDWGRRNAASFHIYSVRENKYIHSAHEIYKRDISIPEFSSLMKQSPNYKDLIWISADPSLWSKNQETKEGLRSLADMFADNNIFLTKGKSRDDEIAINELLDRWNKLDERESSFTISPRCMMQIWEFERLRYKELSTAMIEKSNPAEQLIDKDNHAWDDFKYFISTWITGNTLDSKPKALKGSLAYEIERQEREDNDWRSKFN